MIKSIYVFNYERDNEQCFLSLKKAVKLLKSDGDNITCVNTYTECPTWRMTFTDDGGCTFNDVGLVRTPELAELMNCLGELNFYVCRELLERAYDCGFNPCEIRHDLWLNALRTFDLTQPMSEREFKFKLLDKVEEYEPLEDLYWAALSYLEKMGRI